MSEIEKNLIEEIKQIINITSRTDEKVKMIVDNQTQINQRLDHFIDEHNELVSKVYVIEAKNGHKAYELIKELDDRVDVLESKINIIEIIGSSKHTEELNKHAVEIDKHEDKLVDILPRIKELEEHKSNISEKIKSLFGYVLQALYFIAISYLLYKMGLNPPPGH